MENFSGSEYLVREAYEHLFKILWMATIHEKTICEALHEFPVC